MNNSNTKSIQENKPAEIANFFIGLAKQEGIPITPMKLLKLCYIGYGWCLTLLDRKRIFEEKIEAWKFGPVIPSLYHEFKDFGSESIDRFALDVSYSNDDKVEKLSLPLVSDERVRQILGLVWDTYKNCSAFQLSNLTHEAGSPWSKARLKGEKAPLDDEDIIIRCKQKIDTLSK